MASALYWTGRAVLVWPLMLLWRLATLVEKAVGIALCLALGVVFMGLGMLLNMTFFGMVLGVPLFFVGLLLAIRGLF